MRKSVHLTLLVACVMLFWQCGGSETGDETSQTEMEMDMNAEMQDQTEPSLTLVWETEESLTTNESVLFDDATGTVYVANINGDPSEKDGNGSIGTISLDGEILDGEWVSGLNAPKGMGILDGKLYVTDIDELVEIDIASATVSQTYPVEGAEFLNDVDAAGSRVYFSDSGTGTIHVLEDGEVDVFAEGQEGINGLRIDSDGTLYGLDGSGLKVYDEEGNAEIINDVVTGGDGLIILGDDNYLASRWQGEVWIVLGEEEVKLLDTTADESNTADIEYIEEENLVLVPTFFKNKVAAYRLDY